MPVSSPGIPMFMNRRQSFHAWLSRKPLRVYIIFFLLAVLPILLFFYSAGLVLEEKAKGRAMQEGTQAATLGGVLIKDHFEQSTRFLASFACRPLLREAVVGRDVKKMTGHLQSAQEIGSGFQFFSVYDPSGTQLAVYPPELRSGHNYAYRDWYKGVSRDWRPYVSEVYQTGTSGNPLVVAVAVPIRNDQREVIGILM